MKHISLSYVSLVVAIFSLFPLRALADSEPEGTPLFTISSTNSVWAENSQPGVEMVSLENPGGTSWKTWAFTHASAHYGLNCGIREVGTTATLTSTSPVADKIGVVSAYIVYDGSAEYLNSVKLRVAPSADFTTFQEIDCPVQTSAADFWNFTIPEPAENQYYQLRIDFKPFQNNWISLHVVNFFSPDSQSGISQVEAGADNAAPIYYNLQGQRVASPAHGVYIELANGQARKVRL